MKKLLLSILLIGACSINITNAFTCEDVDGMYADSIESFRKAMNDLNQSGALPVFIDVRKSYDAWLMLGIMHGECHEQSKDDQEKIRDMRVRMKSFRQLENELQESCHQDAGNADKLIDELEKTFKASAQPAKK